MPAGFMLMGEWWEAREKQILNFRLSCMGTVQCPHPRCPFSASVGSQELQNLPLLPRFLSKTYCLASLITILQSCRSDIFFLPFLLIAKGPSHTQTTTFCKGPQSCSRKVVHSGAERTTVGQTLALSHRIVSWRLSSMHLNLSPEENKSSS